MNVNNKPSREKNSAPGRGPQVAESVGSAGRTLAPNDGNSPGETALVALGRPGRGTGQC